MNELDVPPLVFESHERDIQPLEMEHKVKSARRKQWELKAQLEVVKTGLWNYESSSWYSKSMARAKEAGLTL